MPIYEYECTSCCKIIEAIQPFIIIKRPLFSPSVVYRFQTRLETPLRNGYRSRDYNNPFYLQHRILFHANSYLRGGIIWEKDAGENHMFDYGSFYLQFHHPARIVTLIASTVAFISSFITLQKVFQFLQGTTTRKLDWD